MPPMAGAAAPTRLPLAAAFVVIAAVAATGGGRALISDRLTRLVAVPPGHALSIAVTNGSVRIDSDASRRDVRFDITRQAPSAAQLARLPVVLTSPAGGPRLEALQTHDGRDPELRTDLRVVAPRDLAFALVTVQEGRIEVHGAQGGVRAVVERGAIVADDVSGEVRLETTIGPIDVTRARLSPAGLFRVRTFNGDVRLGFAAPLENARVMALALNGTITSTLPLTEVAGWGPRWAQAALGRADQVVSVDVVTGTIRIDAPR